MNRIPDEERPEEQGPLAPDELVQAELLEAWLAGRRDAAPDAALVRSIRGQARAAELREAPVGTRLANEVLAGLRFERAAAGPGARLREGLRRSVALRVLAASLLVHLLTLPAVAWFWLRPDPVPDYVITFEPAPSPAEGETWEPLPARRPPEGEAEAPTAADCMRLDRYRLSRAARTASPVTAGRGSAAHWFAWRVEALDAARRFAPSDLGLALDDALARSSLLEAALDRVAQEPSDALARSLVARGLEAVSGPEWGEDPHLARLRERARARAARYGLVEGPARDVDPTPHAWLLEARPLLEGRAGWGDVLRAVDPR